ncbi:hydrogenase 3 large subunit [Candidatus Heimdallarchaeota archaeon B3_Heim]|nr:MAG: hydrogenase 3 large subunit [Candidatus Heimdallarchaeota archaeon B3_Heim]
MKNIKPETLVEVATSLNLTIRELRNYPSDCYVNVQAERLIEIIKILKKKYDVSHLSTIVVQDIDEDYKLLYPFSVHLPEEKIGNFILDVKISKCDPKINSIVPEIPGAFLYEQEVFDMMGIHFENHPNLKRILTPDTLPKDLFPLRKNISSKEIRDGLKNARKNKEAEEKLKEYIRSEQFEYISEKSDYAISVGPQHPALEEPIRFIFHVEGETVKNVELRLGFNHRGIEKAFESRTWLQNLYLAERICGICSDSHQLCYVQAVEKCNEISDEIPERALYIRTILAELERIHSHLLWYGVLAHNAGFDTMFQYTWRDREIVMDILERISGNRVNYAMHTIGGVRRDISPEQVLKIIPKLKELRKRVIDHQKMMMNEKSFIIRQEGIAILTKAEALRFCAVGPNARSSGIDVDIRRNDPYAAYNQLSFDIPIRTEGDIFSGLIIRLEETLTAIDLAVEALETLPQGKLNIKVPRKIPQGEGMSRVEAPRGEDIHYVQSNGTNKPERFKVRAPTLANIPSLLHRLIGVQVADIPPVIRVIDPCIGCMDRVTFIDLKKELRLNMSGAHLISRANRAYRLGTKILNL